MFHIQTVWRELHSRPQDVSDSRRTQCTSRIARDQVSSSKGQPDDMGEESDPPPESSSSPWLPRRRLGASAEQAPLKSASGDVKAENGDSGTNEPEADRGNGKSRTVVSLGGCRDKGATRRDVGCDAQGMGDDKRVNCRSGGRGTANGCDSYGAHGTSKQFEDNTVRVILVPITWGNC